MSHTHTTCNCPDWEAETDDWGQTAPDSSRPATESDEQPSEALEDVPTPDGPSAAFLPRRIAPEDVRPGMVIETRHPDLRRKIGRVEYIDSDGWINCEPVWVPDCANYAWSLWLIEDAPTPPDPDADLVEVMARVIHDLNHEGCKAGDWDGHVDSVQDAWREDAREVLATVRAEGLLPEAVAR